MKKKKAPLFPLLFLTLIPPLFLAGGLFLCFRNPGFNPSKIGSTLLCNDNWDIGPLQEELREHLIKNVFSQEFYCFGSESRCYIFISRDRNYILKLFKTKSLSPAEWWMLYPFSGLRYLGFNHKLDNQFLSEHIFAIYKNAYESLRCECGLLHIHLNRTKEFEVKVSLINQKGRKYLINLDAFEFVLQKKAEPILEYLESRIQQPEALRAALRSFLQLVAIRCEKGFTYQNVSLHNHYGFIDSQPILFDCGLLTKDLSMKYPLSIQREIIKATERLNLWANEHCPEITFMIQEEAQQIINQLF